MAKTGPKPKSSEALAEVERKRRLKFIGAELSAREIARFKAKVDTSDGSDACWPWTGCRHKFGYGRMSLRSRKTGKWMQESSHRIALWIATGNPPQRSVLHSCDNPPCCNPAHLREGTPKDNTADAMSRGRLVFPPVRTGEANSASKLTSEDVVSIRARLNESKQRLAEEFGVSPATIKRIASGKTWKIVK